MSSAKNYILNIETDDNDKAVTFFVRQKPSFFLRFLRAPLVALLLALSIPSLIEISNSVNLSGTGARAYLPNLLFHNNGPFLSGETRHVVTAVVSVLAALLLAIVQQPSDSIIIMENMGVQLNSTKWWSFSTGLSNREFIPLSDIIDIVIHEGFHGYGQVIFYMCVLTRCRSSNTDSGTGNSVKVVFPHFLPRKDILLQVWKQSLTMLYGEKRRHFRYVPGQGLKKSSTH